MNERPAGWHYSTRPVLVGLAFGLIVGETTIMDAIGLAAQLLFCAGLVLTYGSIGVSVALLPSRGPRWLFGALVGTTYSLPGALFTAVPVPLRDDAPAYYRNFAGGGARERAMTLLYGIAVGPCCGLALKPRKA